ncbi:MAG: hypothetical protein U5K73_03475 [Halofilum sp. (in: g-proteobacteria)]|nr:hypothetical protein [Halofilum sp. (in: g-proteobacteria)]
MEYFIIAESGKGFRPDQEVQGLTLEAVGSGTTINHIQAMSRPCLTIAATSVDELP